jgi:hypothetical protein
MLIFNLTFNFYKINRFLIYFIEKYHYLLELFLSFVLAEAVPVDQIIFTLGSVFLVEMNKEIIGKIKV